jgi:succinate dehydrogenase flavin-adding protein (antitoxin of CptAB toxin-antitoxin module)
MLAQRQRQLKNLTPGTEDYRSMQKSIRLVENGIKRINNSFNKYVKEVKNRAKTRIRLEEKDRKILEKSTLRKIIEGEYFESLDDAGKKLYQEMLEKGDDLLDFIKGFGPGASINAKPMSNDIAMLNTDTGYRDIYVYKVDSDSFFS